MPEFPFRTRPLPFIRFPALLVGLTVAASLLSGCTFDQPARALRIASGSTSMTLCTAAFVSGFDPDRAFRLEVTPAPGMELVNPVLGFRIDRGAGTVESSLAGTFRTRAVYRPGLGCVLALGPLGPHALERWSPDPARSLPPDPFPDLARTRIHAPASPAVAAAIDRAFGGMDGDEHHTLAVVVVQHGQIVGERYAPGVTPTMPLPGHSLSKSVIHALVGILAGTHTLDADAPLEVPAWHAPVTPAQLLAMEGGLPWDETHGGFDQATRMWFDESDPAAYAESVPLDTAPGTHWAYSNLGYAVLSRLVRDHTGGNAAATRDWMQRALFDRLGMQDTVVGFDATGTPMGANGVLASARDWARLGLLYLHEGKVGGETILPPGWVARARTQTLDAGYGSGFWLNTTDAPHPLPGRWGMPHAPREAFFGRGYLGQFVVVVPSADLVVVRLGITYRNAGDIATVGQLVHDLVAVLPG